MQFLREIYTDVRVRRLRAKCHRFWIGVKRWCFRRQFLLQRLPWLVVEPAVALGDGQYVLSGWLFDPGRRVDSVSIKGVHGESLDITQSMLFYDDARLSKKLKAHAEAPKPRFMVQFSVEKNGSGNLAASDQSYVLEVRKRGGGIKTTRIQLLPVAVEPLGDIRRLLSQLPVVMGGKRKLFDSLLGPAITRMWANRENVETTAAQVVEYNASLAPRAPDVSLIIPVYGRFDFIEHQLTRFATDDDMRRHDIIFVLDDPRLEGAVRQHAFHWEQYFSLAFRIVYLGSNHGYAAANNRGVEHARADTLLLLNSDVLPQSGGWVSELAASASEPQTDTGPHATNASRVDHATYTVMGARLLYEDQTIQHDGMHFYASPFMDDLWTNTHPNKGMPTDVVSVAPTPFDVEAVTGACLLIPRALYVDLGGFDENYILGDFEDSDLCLRARSRGAVIKQNSAVVLYHLERQSQSLVSADQWKSEISYYNCWYHTQLWSDDILALKGLAQ